MLRIIASVIQPCLSDHLMAVVVMTVTSALDSVVPNQCRWSVSPLRMPLTLTSQLFFISAGYHGDPHQCSNQGDLSVWVTQRTLIVAGYIMFFSDMNKILLVFLYLY